MLRYSKLRMSLSAYDAAFSLLHARWLSRRAITDEELSKLELCIRMLGIMNHLMATVLPLLEYVSSPKSRTILLGIVAKRDDMVPAVLGECKNLLAKVKTNSWKVMDRWDNYLVEFALTSSCSAELAEVSPSGPSRLHSSSSRTDATVENERHRGSYWIRRACYGIVGGFHAPCETPEDEGCARTY